MFGLRLIFLPTCRWDGDVSRPCCTCSAFILWGWFFKAYRHQWSRAFGRFVLDGGSAAIIICKVATVQERDAHIFSWEIWQVWIVRYFKHLYVILPGSRTKELSLLLSLLFLRVTGTSCESVFLNIHANMGNVDVFWQWRFQTAEGSINKPSVELSLFLQRGRKLFIDQSVNFLTCWCCLSVQ